MKRLLTCLILLSVTPLAVRAQQWSGILDPSRAIDWSNAGIPGGIPNRTSICATLSPGATSSQINNAIASCPAGQVVFLNAGTYNIAGGINFAGHSNVTLRGAGPTQTILQFSSGDGCGGLGGDLCVSAASTVYPGGNPASLANWTAGYGQGTTQISLSTTSGLSVGSLIVLDQANDAVDTGGVFLNDTMTYTSEGGSPGRNIGSVNRSQQQFVRVTAINGNTVTISPGLYMNNWRASQSPQVWIIPSPITMVGIENMTLDHTGSGTTVGSGTYFYNCYQCWVKNIKSLNANRNHVWMFSSARVVVRDSFFYGTQNGAQQSYGIEPYYTSDDLIENNIFDHGTSPIVAGDMTGVVAAYNLSINSVYNVTSSYLQDMYSSHDAGDSMNLFEGNQGMFIACDNIHGTSQLGTYFRNQLTGWQSGKSNQTVPVLLDAFCRGYNLIGNVLGTAGYHNNYEATVGASSSNCNTSILNIGWSSTLCGTSGPPTDPITARTLMLWGNYDVVHATVQWNSSDIPTSGVPFINGNAVPANHNLPASFYVSAKPSWWGLMPWPAIGADVAGGTIAGVGGLAYSIPAQVCYNSTPKDSSGILVFDANKCYGSLAATAPAPPTGLTVVVQ